MTAALAHRAGLPGTLRDNAYVLPADLSLEEAGRVIRLLDVIVAGSPWWLADALTFVEDKFGEEHAQILPGPDEDPLGVSQARMKQAAWLGRVYPAGTRVPEASWTHHRIVAELPAPDRRELLDQVAQAVKDVAAGVEGATLISTRELGRRKKQREQAIQGKAVTLDGAPVGGDDLDWHPTKDQLVDECRASLEVRLSEMSSRMRPGFEAGWLAALVWVNALDCFKRDGE